MISYEGSLKLLYLPILGVIILEVLWNILDSFINPTLLNMPLHLIKYLLYALAGYISRKLYKTTQISAAISGSLTAGIGALAEGLVISQLFYHSFFYMPGFGFPFIAGLYHVLSLALVGLLCGYVGSAASVVGELDFIAYSLKFVGPSADEIGIPSEPSSEDDVWSRPSEETDTNRENDIIKKENKPKP